MTQGVFIYGSRPKTKAQLKTTVDQINAGEADPYSVVIEATSMFGNEFDGSLAKAVNCQDSTCPNAVSGSPADSDHHIHEGPFYLVGPDPYTSRKWYASLTYDSDQKKWKVK